jgi:photosystem II stability/assembly factor-like uncharacterized protein
MHAQKSGAVPGTASICILVALLFGCNEERITSPVQSTPGIPQWEATNGIPGRVYSLCSDGGGHLFAGTDASNIFVSTNEGTSWAVRKVDSRQYFSNPVRAIVAFPNGIVYAGTTGGGVFRSNNLGQSWSRISSNLSDSSVYSLSVSSVGPIFAATTNAIFRSTDQGQTWETALDSAFALTLVNDSRGYTYAAVSVRRGTIAHCGVYRTTDNGRTWAIAKERPTILNMHVDARNNVWLVDYNGIARSTDGGSSWFNVGPFTANGFCLTTNSQGHIFTGGLWGIYSSFDDGHTWTFSDSDGLEGRSIWQLASNTVDRLFAATDSGVFRTRSN